MCTYTFREDERGRRWERKVGEGVNLLIGPTCRQDCVGIVISTIILKWRALDVLKQCLHFECPEETSSIERDANLLFLIR